MNDICATLLALRPGRIATVRTCCKMGRSKFATTTAEADGAGLTETIDFGASDGTSDGANVLDGASGLGVRTLDRPNDGADVGLGEAAALGSAVGMSDGKAVGALLGRRVLGISGFVPGGT